MASANKNAPRRIASKLKTGDIVMVIAGGNKKKNRVLKGQTGKILKFLPSTNRVIVEGLNKVTRHKRAMTATDSAGKIEKDGSVHISNVMYYSEELKRPVRVKSKTLGDGRKVRGYLNPKTKEFEQIDV